MCKPTDNTRGWLQAFENEFKTFGAGYDWETIEKTSKLSYDSTSK